MRLRKLTIVTTLSTAVAGLSIALASSASASTTIDVRGSWAEIATSQGANYPQTVTWMTEDFSTGALTGTDVGGGATFTITGTITGAKITTHLVEDGVPSYTSDSVGIIDHAHNVLTWSGTFTDSSGHDDGTFTATFNGPGANGPGANVPSPAGNLGATPIANSGGEVLDVRGLWDGYYIQPGGAKYHNPVDILTEDFTTGALTGTDNGTDGAATVTLTISGRTISGSIDQPASNYHDPVSWTLSDDGTRLIAGGITDPTAPNAFVLFRHGAPVGGTSGLTTGAGVTSGPAPINALPTPAQAFSSPARIAVSLGISIAALLLITFPANLFNKTFEENYDVIAAWWAPRLRRLRRKPAATQADGGEAAAVDEAAAARREQWVFGSVVVAGAILGGLLNPKFGANSASADSFVATLLTVLTGTVLGAVVATVYRRRKGYPITRHLQALPAGLAIAALCVVLSRVSNFQPGYLYGVVCGVAFAGALAKNENGHLVALTHLATIGLAVVAWFLWVPVNHAAVHHPGVFPLVILDDLLASLFVGGLVGSVINLIPVRFMPGHALASWHRGVWMAVFGVATFGMTEIVLFPSLHNHAGHAPLVTIIVLFVLFGGGSLAFREYFSRRTKRLEQAAATPVIPEPRSEAAVHDEPVTAVDPPGIH